MKKILLTLGVAAIAVGAWAVQTFTTDTSPTPSEELIRKGYMDVTPSSFKFCEGNQDTDIFRSDISGLGAANINNSNIANNTNGGKEYFTNETLTRGNLVVGGSYQNSPGNITKGFTYVTLGDQIKDVLVLNGANSNLQAELEKKFGIDTKLNSLDAITGNFQLFWIMDYPAMNKEIPENTPIRFRVELNAYHNDMTSTSEVFNGMFVMNDQANAFGTQDKSITFSEFADENGNWNPNRWMVYEQEVPYNRLPSYIKMFYQASTGGLNGGAILLRNIEIYGLPNSDYKSDFEPGIVYESWNTYTTQDVDPEDPTEPEPEPAPDITTKSDIFPESSMIPTSIFVDVTPKYFKFHKNDDVNLTELFRSDIKSPNQTNLGNGNFISTNTGESADTALFTPENLKNGNIIFKSGGYWNDENPDLMNGVSVVKFDENVGNVLVLNGKNSKLNEYLGNLLNVDAPAIPQLTGDFKNLQLMWIMDYLNMRSQLENPQTLRIRMEYNVYNNDMSSGNNSWTGIFYQKEGGASTEITNDVMPINYFTYRKGDSGLVDNNYDPESTNEWNPYRWAVWEGEVSQNAAASFIRTFINFTNSPDYNNGALLIRSLEFYGVPDYLSSMEENKMITSWNEYQPTPCSPSVIVPEQSQDPETPDVPDDPNDEPGDNPGESDDDFVTGDYSGEQTVNRAVQFTEEGFVNCGAMPELNNLASYSLQFWMKPNKWEEGASLMHRGDSFSVELGGDHTVLFKNGNNTVTATGFEPEAWNQVTLIVNNGTASVLVNDKEAGNGVLGELETTKRPFVMGGGYNGLLDEVRLWNDALDNNDLMKRFDYFTHNTLNKWNPMWENLVAYYKMDQEVAPQIIEYKVLETKKADGTNNHGAVTKQGVKRVEANNEKMPYLLNAAYTENERFYDRLIPRDAYLLSNEIIVLGADCVAEDGSVKTRLPNNHGSIYGGVTYVDSVLNRGGVAYFDGDDGSYIQAPAASTHQYKVDSSSPYTNTDLSTYSFVLKFLPEEWKAGAYLIRKGTAENGMAISMGLDGSGNKTMVLESNGGKYEFPVNNFRETGWNNFGVAAGKNGRGTAWEYVLMFNGQQQTFTSANSTVTDMSLLNVKDEPVKIGEGFKGYMDDIFFNNKKLGIGMMQTYANNLIVPSVEQGRNIDEMNASGFGYRFDNADDLGYSSYSQDYIADYIRSLYKGYSPAKVVLSVRGHSDNNLDDAFRVIMNDPAKTQKFAQDLINAADKYDGVEFDLEWCEGATQWSNLSKLSDAVEALLPDDGSKSFRISIHNGYYDFPKDKINHEKITGFTVQQYGPNPTWYPYNKFESGSASLLNYGYPKEKTVLSFSTTMESGGDVRGGAFANYDITQDDGNQTLYNGKNYMSPLQIFKRAKYARENNYQGIFYWAMGNDYWLGSKDMGSGGKVNYEGMPEYNGAKYCSFGLNANIDRVVLSANFNHPETENAEYEDVEIPELPDQSTGDGEDDDNGDDNNGDDNGDDDNNGDTSDVNSLESVEYVDVYNVNGFLIKKNVNKAELNQVLENGIYIINGQKTIVK